MDSEISGTVLSASPRITGNGKTIYDIAFSDGNTYCTFDAKIWAKVQAVAQQPATARVSVQQKGDFTNFYLNDIAPQGQLAATSAPVATQAAAPLIRAHDGRGSMGMSPEREQKIVKQSSFATAFNFVASLYQGAGESELETATLHAKALAADLYGHVMGTEPAAEPTPEPVAVAAATNGTSDGIPW